MKEKNGLKLYPEWRELAEVAEIWEYGSVHKHSEIAEIMGIPQQETKYYQYVSRANEILTPKGKLLQIVVGTGYLVVHPDDYIDRSFDQVKKSMDHLLRAVTISQSAPVELMSLERRIEHEAYNVNLAAKAALTMRELDSKKRIAAPSRYRIETRPKLENKNEVTENANG